MGAIEGLNHLFTVQIESISVLRVKELSKKLFAGTEKVTEIEYQQGRGKGWMFNNKRISIHCLEAYLVYYLFKIKYYDRINTY